ncbi:Rha family transcriptional regulator [uncultured Campylobacter sp.]|uniref:Rha family transcriptional regulator n=1 Tax=uncultured Campylobacter sp. TaxID=218934 RepID=UPI002610E4B9|nr:Rha family transcriptional regulator [uncultured Campylobacter sp.]
MKNLVVINDQSVEFEVMDNGIFTTSLSVAAVFEKRHADIIAKISEFPTDDFNERNFSLVKYQDQKGEFRPMYKMTRDGFSLLVMGFTGERAYKWKIEFIAAFNKMEAMIKRGNSHLDAIIDNMGVLNEKIDKLQAKNSALAGELIEASRKYTAALERENALLRRDAEGAGQLLKKSTKLSEAERDEVARLYESGLSQAQICRRLGRSDTAVRNAIRSRSLGSASELFGGAL